MPSSPPPFRWMIVDPLVNSGEYSRSFFSSS
jgi:hypothetical protein